MREIFTPRHSEEPGKVMPLGEAVRQAIVPGMILHISSGSDPNAALREIIRLFWGTEPGFTLIASGVTTPYVISLITCQLVKKVITSNCSYTYPTPRPIPLLQEAEKNGSIEIENWSLYSLEQRLMAAAMGVGFMPTKSIMGTSLAEDNVDSFKIISDPFNEENKLGIVKALEPDISIIHGCVADVYGNTILGPPYFSNLWGSRASRNGVIVTVEKIVSPEFIKEHSSLVKIPGYLVRSISEAPFGAHPQSLAGLAIGIEDDYSEDYDFIVNYQKVSRDPNHLDVWLKEWITDCPTQEDYLRKLGTEKIASLKEKASNVDWESELKAGRTLPVEEANSTEMMVVVAARRIQDKVFREGYQTILAGIGIPGLATWLAYYLLRKEGHYVDLLTGTGLVGYTPIPGDPFLMSPANVMTCTMLTDTIEVYGTFVGGARSKCLSVLGAAQIDRYGNINTLRIDNLFFIGTGGAADAINAQESLVVAKQSSQRLIERVPSISCLGDRVKTLVTNLGIMEKDEDEEFTLTSYYAGPGFKTQEISVREIRENCGWELKMTPSLEEIEAPTSDELTILRSLDPQRLFIGK